ncbi:TlpA family protein disulfide reductase [Lysobacter sp. D1-1-M9]|uniref:TlpA family protein disulfide reductase n=1 Tax=Novilysobacter longmucuonensis TaxID=3098603 RepID=UPI002FCAAD42
MPRPLTMLLAALLIGGGLAACDPGSDTPGPAPASTAPEPAVAEAPMPESSEPAIPSLQVATLAGEQYDLAARRGQWVVVNFWATWCAPCLKEMPELSALDAMHEHIEVIGLAYEEIDPAAMREFLDEHPVVYPVAIVDTYAPPADFATPRGLPMTYLIAPDGRVAGKFLGPVTAHDIEAAIAAAGGPAATTEAT